MAGNRVTPAMRKARKLSHALHRARRTNLQRVLHGSRMFGGLSRSKAVDGLLPTRRRSWKGPTGFHPRCKKGHVVDFDMARCYRCKPHKTIGRPSLGGGGV